MENETKESPDVRPAIAKLARGIEKTRHIMREQAYKIELYEWVISELVQRNSGVWKCAIPERPKKVLRHTIRNGVITWHFGDQK
jgi:hypothetical protein